MNDGLTRPTELVTTGYYRGLTRRAARASKSLLALAIAGMVVMGVILGRALWLERRWSRGYSLIQRGDSHARVVVLMGPGARVHECGPELRWGDTILERSDAECVTAESYAPFPFFERWTFEFDDGGKVVGKYYWDFD